MAGRLTRSISYRIEFDLSDDHLSVNYEPETGDDFATFTLSEVTVRTSELNGLIDGLIKIRDEVVKYEEDEANAMAARDGISD